MTDESHAPVSKWALWIGRVMSTLPVLMLFMSAYMKISKNPQAVEGFTEIGYKTSHLVPIGIVEIICTVLYIIPQTAVLGAVLLTGYLGGAVATHVIGDDGMFMNPVIFGVVLWGGLFLRDRRIRALMPLRRKG